MKSRIYRKVFIMSIYYRLYVAHSVPRGGMSFWYLGGLCVGPEKEILSPLKTKMGGMGVL